MASRSAASIDPDDHFAVRFINVEGRSWAAVADGPRVQPGRWYHVAATSNGRRLQLYVDANDGRGYRLRAGTALAAAGDTSLGSGGDAAEWSIGRGKSGRQAGGVVPGWIDEVRITTSPVRPRNSSSPLPPWQRHKAKPRAGNEKSEPDCDGTVAARLR